MVQHDQEKHEVEVRNMKEMVRAFNRLKADMHEKEQKMQHAVLGITSEINVLKQKINLLYAKMIGGGPTSGN